MMLINSSNLETNKQEIIQIQNDIKETMAKLFIEQNTLAKNLF